MLTIVFHFFIEVVVKYNINTIQNHIFLNHKVQFIAKDILNTKKTLITLIKKTKRRILKSVFADETQRKTYGGVQLFPIF